MADCPQCGLPPTAVTEDAATKEPYDQCQNGHMWKMDPEPEG
jgi:hypothetical protein